MKSLREVRRLGGNRYWFMVERDGTEHEIVVEMSLQIPQRRVAWRTASGEESSGVVSFEPEPGGGTKISLEMLYEPSAGWHEPAALSERLESHLENFKRLIETGAC